MESKSNKNVLVFTSVHLPNDNRIVKQLETLTLGGFRCTLVAPWLGEGMSDSHECIYFTRSLGFLGRLKAQWKLIRSAASKKYDIIHFHDFDTIITASLIKIITKTTIIYDVHENYGQEVLVRGYIPDFVRTPLSRLVNKIEKRCVKILNKAIVVTPDQEKRLIGWGCKEVALVRNYAKKSFAPNNTSQYFENLESKYVFNSGGQTISTGAIVLLETAERLNRLQQPIKICVIDRFEGTRGLKEMVIERAAVTAGNYKILPRVPHNQLGNYLQFARIGLSLGTATETQGIAIPTKLFEYMAYGIPIIATDVGYQSQIIKETGAGILVNPGDSQMLAAAIQRLWEDSSLCKQLGENGKRAFFDRYSWETEGETLLKFYRSQR